jgi:two-component system, OmpR family, phosphate regulon sensor histidine kinase PhoR
MTWSGPWSEGGKRVDVFNDSIAWRRIFLYLILPVVVPTILLTLYGVAAINYLRVAVEADLTKRYDRQSRMVEQGILNEVGRAGEALEKALRAAPFQDTQEALERVADDLPLVADVWLETDEAGPALVEEVLRRAGGDPNVLVSLDIGEEIQVFGIVSEGDTHAVWRLDPGALQTEALPRVLDQVAERDTVAVARYRIRTTRPAVGMGRSFQETLQAFAEEGPIVDRPMTPPLDRWYLTASPSPDLEVTTRIANTRGFYVAGMVLLVGAVITGVSLTGRALFREMRLSQLQTDFVSNVSHELRTPLTSIRMFIETLQSGRVRDPVRMQECLDVVAAESERLSRMIERILGWARMEAGRRIYSFEPVPPGVIVQRALDAFRTQQLQDTEATVQVDVDANLRPVRADLEAVTEALLNLLNNAWKYTGTDKRIAIRTLPGSTGVGIEVSDNGPGIPREERKRVFEKFYRADMLLTRKTQGSGLGLAIVRAIAYAHDGKVELESEEGRGSRFTLWLKYA